MCSIVVYWCDPKHLEFLLKNRNFRKSRLFPLTVGTSENVNNIRDALHHTAVVISPYVFFALYDFYIMHTCLHVSIEFFLLISNQIYVFIFILFCSLVITLRLHTKRIVLRAIACNDREYKMFTYKTKSCIKNSVLIYFSYN